jgi:hypothetical protein
LDDLQVRGNPNPNPNPNGDVGKGAEKKSSPEIVTPRILDYGEERNGNESTTAAETDHSVLPSKTFPPREEEQEQESEATTMPIGDLPGATIHDADRNLLGVYDDYIHQDDRTHLDGGIKDDAVWQERWRTVVTLPGQRYNAPGGAVGRYFVRLLTEELNCICSRKWNSEKYIVFQMVILQKSKLVTAAGDIKRRLSKWMDSWEECKFDMLVEDSARTALSQLTRARGLQTEEQRAKTFA